LCILNIVAHGVSGVQMRSMGCMGWGFGEISGGVGELSSQIVFEIGDCSKIRCWHGLWYGDQALKIVFPNLFKIDRFEVVPKAYQLELSSALY